jgi:hypothetical protein
VTTFAQTLRPRETIVPRPRRHVVAPTEARRVRGRAACPILNATVTTRRSVWSPPRRHPSLVTASFVCRWPLHGFRSRVRRRRSPVCAPGPYRRSPGQFPWTTNPRLRRPADDRSALGRDARPTWRLGRAAFLSGNWPARSAIFSDAIGRHPQAFRRGLSSKPHRRTLRAELGYGRLFVAGISRE